MHYKIIITDEFYDYLFNLKTYYLKFLYWSFLDNFNNFIITYIWTLNFLPHRCKFFDEKKWIRALIIEWKYKIFYKINENKKEVYILKISLSTQNDINFF